VEVQHVQQGEFDPENPGMKPFVNGTYKKKLKTEGRRLKKVCRRAQEEKEHSAKNATKKGKGPHWKGGFTEVML